MQITPETVVVEVLEAVEQMEARAVLVVQEMLAAAEVSQARTLHLRADQKTMVREQHRE